MDYKITYILPEAIEWLSNRKIDFVLLPYDDCTLQLNLAKKLFDYGPFESFLFSKAKQARKKQQTSTEFKYHFSIRARHANKLDYNHIFKNIDTKSWYIKPSNVLGAGNLSFMFKNEQDCNLVRLMII